MTIAGKFSTEGMVEKHFQLTELNPTATITGKLHVAKSLGAYDMIIGRDLLNKIGLTLDFATETVSWEEASIPMKCPTATAIESLHIEDPPDIDDMVGRIAGDNYKKILRAKYGKADLRKEITSNSSHLETTQQENLLQLLQKYETLFDSTLGTWKGVSYNITLKEGEIPYHGCLYTIPRAYKKTATSRGPTVRTYWNSPKS